MMRAFPILAALALASCSSTGSPARTEDISDEGKDDGLAAASVAPKLQPLLAFLRDDKNIVTQLGPEETVAANVRKKVKVVRYTEFGRAVDVAARAIARNYQVDVGTTYRRGYGLVDLISVGDMYVTAKTGYGDDSFVDKLVTASKRTEAKRLLTTLLPEAAWLSADHASTTSTGNYVAVFGDIASEQAIVLTIEYEIE